MHHILKIFSQKGKVGTGITTCNNSRYDEATSNCQNHSDKLIKQDKELHHRTEKLPKTTIQRKGKYRSASSVVIRS